MLRQHVLHQSLFLSFRRQLDVGDVLICTNSDLLVSILLASPQALVSLALTTNQPIHIIQTDKTDVASAHFITKELQVEAVKPINKPWMSALRKKRQEEVLLCRLRIGHTYTAHGDIILEHILEQILNIIKASAKLHHPSILERSSVLRSPFQWRTYVSRTISVLPGFPPPHFCEHYLSNPT